MKQMTLLAVLALGFVPFVARAEGPTVGLFADPWGRIQLECVQQTGVPFEVYVVATGDFTEMSAVDLSVTVPEDASLLLLGSEVLVDGNYVEVFEGPSFVMSGAFGRCRAFGTRALARLVFLPTIGFDASVELQVDGFAALAPHFLTCEDEVRSFAAVDPLVVQPGSLCCPTDDRRLLADGGRVPFPSGGVARFALWYERTTQDDELARTICSSAGIYGVRGRLEFDPALLSFAEFDDTLVASGWEFTTETVEAGNVAFEMRDPASRNGSGEVELPNGSNTEVRFDVVEFFLDTEVRLESLEFCVDGTDGGCVWRSAAVSSLRVQILTELAGDASTFGTLKTKFHDEGSR